MRGFTLIELLVSFSITIVAGALLVVILGQNNSIFLKQQSNVLQGVSLNEAGLLISDSIKQASSVAETSPTTPVYTTNINTLVLQVPSTDNSGNVIPNVFDYFVIAPDNLLPNILRLMVFPTSPSVRRSQDRVLLTTLSNIRFLYFNSAGVQVSPTSAEKINYTINLREKAGLVYQQSSASGEVNLRNN